MLGFVEEQEAATGGTAGGGRSDSIRRIRRNVAVSVESGRQ